MYNQENFNTLLFVIEWYNYDQANTFIYRTISPIEFDYGDLFERLLLTSCLVFFHNFLVFFSKTIYYVCIAIYPAISTFAVQICYTNKFLLYSY